MKQYFSSSDLAQKGMGRTGTFRRQSCCQSLCKINQQISPYFLHSSTGQRGNEWDYFKVIFTPTYVLSRKIVKKIYHARLDEIVCFMKCGNLLLHWTSYFPSRCSKLLKLWKDIYCLEKSLDSSANFALFLCPRAIYSLCLIKVSDVV